MTQQNPEEPGVPIELREEVEVAARGSLAGWSKWALAVVATTFGALQFYAAGARPMLSTVLFPIHLAFAIAVVLLAYPLRKTRGDRRVPLYDLVLIAIAAAAAAYVVMHSSDIMNFTYTESNADLILGTALVLLTLEASRRSLGLVFPILVALSILYALFGAYMPGSLATQGYPWEMIVRNLYVSPQGLWGVMLQISATILAIFLIFGAVLLKTGGGEAFIDIAFLASARTRGGPAKVAAIASGLFGTISGSAVANAATIGTFTIPLMKRAGFSREFAAASEAVAGTGGQIMPPVMGAGAFLIAQFLGISYANVAWAAVLPALLYYAGLLFSIHLEAVKHNFPTMQTEEEKLIRSRLTLKKVVLPLIPVAVLIWAFTTGYTVQIGAYWSSWVGLILAVFTVQATGVLSRLWRLLKIAIDALQAGGRAIAEIAVLLASAQIVVSMLGLTGLAVKFSDLLVAIGQQNMIATLVLSMIVLIILGMGIPPTAVYVLGGSIIVPALTLLGLQPLPAHLFTFYFSCLGAITPPVCAAVYVTSSLAQSDWWRSGWLAVRLGLAGFIVPYMFIYSPSLLLNGSLVDILTAAVPAFLGVFFLATFAVGYFAGAIGWLRRILMAVAGVMLIQPGLETDLIGIALGVLVYLSQRLKPLREQPVAKGQG